MPNQSTVPTSEQYPHITCCRGHPEYLTPLVWTYAWPRMEWWCPYCNRHQPMFGFTGDRVARTPELEARLELYKVAARPYLKAVGFSGCVEGEYNGRRTNWAGLADDERAELSAIANAGWAPGRKAEELALATAAPA